ncbi:MAG TPA: hypothetical protein VGO55_17730 [Allosphingosinicella sp.]|nr:hypothetical protein [Allosphingosinicella sp.]
MTAILALQAAADAPADRCRAAQAIAPGFPACAATPHGAVLAESRADAERMAGYARGAEARFEAAFGRPVTPYALLDTSAPAPAEALRTAGYRNVLRWPTAAQFDAATRAGFERATRQFAASQNMSPEQADAMVARALAQRAARTGAGQTGVYEAMIPHELGHLWFTQAYWPNAAAPAGAGRPSHYGGPGPDWLDETAAVILEDDESAARRRDQFARLLRGEPLPSMGRGVPREQVLDLRLFLSREHPALAGGVGPPPTIPAGGSMGVAVTFTPAGSANARPADATLFYLQARRFADYLIETSGRADILAAIARFIAAGGTMEGWLRSEGAGHGLPASLEALDAAWRSWAETSIAAAEARTRFESSIRPGEARNAARTTRLRSGLSWRSPGRPFARP